MVILTQLTLQLITTAIFRDNLSLNVASSLSAMKWRLQPPTLGKSQELRLCIRPASSTPQLGLSMNCRNRFFRDDPSRPQAPSYHLAHPTPGPWSCTTAHSLPHLHPRPIQMEENGFQLTVFVYLKLDSTSTLLVACKDSHLLLEVWRKVEILVGRLAAATIVAVCCYVKLLENKSEFSETKSHWTTSLLLIHLKSFTS